MFKYQRLFLIIVLFALVTGCSVNQGIGEQVNSTSKQNTKKITWELYPVQRVVDGDTIVVIYQHQQEKVRFIGVNTPETHHPYKPVEPYGPEAENYTRQLLTGQQVRLDFDVQKRDKYGRLLAYVYLADGTFVNARLVAEGYAQVMTIPPNVRYANKFLQLQREARAAGKGLWGPEPQAKQLSINQNFVASIKSGKYHTPDCPWAKKINETNKIWFNGVADAQAQGYVPCKVCKPH